jgi:hypothetical protein
MNLSTFIRSQADRVAAVLATAGGAIALLVGWLRISSFVYPAQQIPVVVSGGLTGLFLIGLGAALWLSADLRDEWRKLDRIEDELRAQRHLLETAGAAPALPGRRAATTGATNGR